MEVEVEFLLLLVHLELEVVEEVGVEFLFLLPPACLLAYSTPNLGQVLY